MIYMVEMDFRNPAREADWHAWYLGHVAKLIRNVPGFSASQRFRAITPTPSPWLAMHAVVSGAVFESKEYKANGSPPPPANGRSSTPTGIATCSPASTARPRCRTRPTYSHRRRRQGTGTS